MFSDQYELAVLRQLRAPALGGWAGPVQLAELTGVPQFRVRAVLASLRRRRLVERGGLGHWGEWSITERGMTELARVEQLRLA